jgi:hypothetical protein
MISILVTPDKVRSGKIIGYMLRGYIVGHAHPFTTYVSEPNLNCAKYRFCVFNAIYDTDTLDAAIDKFSDIATPALILAVQ